MLAQRKRHGMVLIHKAYKPPLRNKAENHVTLRNLVVYGKCMPINYSCLSRLGSVSWVQEPLTGYQAITEHFHTQHIGTISPMCIERHLTPLPLIVKRLFGSWVKSLDQEFSFNLWDNCWFWEGLSFPCLTNNFRLNCPASLNSYLCQEGCVTAGVCLTVTKIIQS